LKAGDIFRLDTPGGGGLGNARLREPEKVLADVREGYVSLTRAQEDYGVVLIRDDASLAVDESATKKLRKA
jgi:N-methylhydantoinase B